MMIETPSRSGVPCPAPNLSPNEMLTVLQFEVLRSDTFEEAQNA